MCFIVCFIWLVTCCFVEKVFWLSKEVSTVFGIRRPKSGLRAAKPSLSPYVQNIYRIEVKYIFLEVVHQALSWEFFSEFSFFRYCTAPVENYWHWLLRRLKSKVDKQCFRVFVHLKEICIVRCMYGWANCHWLSLTVVSTTENNNRRKRFE